MSDNIPYYYDEDVAYKDFKQKRLRIKRAKKYKLKRRRAMRNIKRSRRVHR